MERKKLNNLVLLALFIGLIFLLGQTPLGLIPLAGGQVVIDGVDAATLTPRQRAQKAAYLPQTRPVPNITALRMVLHGRFPHLTYPRRFRQEDYAAAMAALEQADAACLARRSMPELSGGQRQRVYLAMALAQDAPTLFLDEPTAFLDVSHQLEVGRLAGQLARQGKAVVLVLHDLPLALSTADRLAVLKGGRLLAVDGPEALCADGILNSVFGIELGRVMTDRGWRYYYL